MSVFVEERLRWLEGKLSLSLPVKSEHIKVLFSDSSNRLVTMFSYLKKFTEGILHVIILGKLSSIHDDCLLKILTANHTQRCSIGFSEQ